MLTNLQPVCHQEQQQRIMSANNNNHHSDQLFLAIETKTQYPDIQVESVNLTSRDQVQAILTECDIIVTATNSSTPLFDGTQVSKRGVHINAVGSYTYVCLCPVC